MHLTARRRPLDAYQPSLEPLYARLQSGMRPTRLYADPQVLTAHQNKIATPTPMLAHSDSGSANTLSGGIWAVFSTHEDVRATIAMLLHSPDPCL